MLDLTHEPDLGYVFYPNETPDHPGHPRMDVIIPAIATHQHYDPQKVQFQIVSPTKNIEHLIVHHPWTLGKKYQVCAGRILLTDHTAKCVEAFSFGGNLQIFTNDKHTVCALKSDAPIIPLFTTHDLPMWIVAEVEILLAQQRAHWNPQHPHDFETHLATVNPFLLYISCLYALQARVKHGYSRAEQLDHQGLDFVQTEIKRLQEKGKLPSVVPSLDQLF